MPTGQEGGSNVDQICSECVWAICKRNAKGVSLNCGLRSGKPFRAASEQGWNPFSTERTRGAVEVEGRSGVFQCFSRYPRPRFSTLTPTRVHGARATPAGFPGGVGLEPISGKKKLHSREELRSRAGSRRASHRLPQPPLHSARLWCLGNKHVHAALPIGYDEVFLQPTYGTKHESRERRSVVGARVRVKFFST